MLLTNSVLRNFGHCSANLFAKSVACSSQQVIKGCNFSSESSLHVNSPYPSVERVVGVTIPELLDSSRGNWGNAIAFEDLSSGEKFTHDEVFRYSRGFATSLLQMGLQKGDKVGIILNNSPYFPIALLGIWTAGLTASPLNPAYTAEEILRQLEMSDSVAAVSSSQYLDTLKIAKSKLSKFKNIILLGEHQEGTHKFSQMMKQEPKSELFLQGSKINTEDFVALLPFSSGTTGPPKAVMLSHSNITNNLKQATQTGLILANRFEKGNEQERFIGVLPMFHAYGLAASILLGNHIYANFTDKLMAFFKSKISVLWNGARVFTLPKFDPKTFLQTFREGKPTICHLVTPLLNLIVHSNDYGKNELEHVKGVMAAAAPIGQTLINNMLDKAGKYVFFQEGYGMTELSPVSHVLHPNTENKKIGSCGAPVASTETKIIDLKDSSIKGRNQRGELAIRGAQVMKGYYNNEKATKETIDEDGWLFTGDIGYYDDDGYLFIVDRKKELIKVKGFQVAPSELEDLLRNHPEVGDVAVIGVPHQEYGEAPRAYIVPSQKSWSNEKSINEYLKDKVADFKQLKGGIEFLEIIPKAPSGKILRRELSLEYKRKNNIPID